MIIDKTLVFCSGQALSGGDAASDIIDLTKGGDALSDELVIMAKVTDAGAGGTSIVIKVQTDSSNAFSSPIDLFVSPTYLTAVLTANKKLFAVRMPRGAKRYLRAYIDVTGTFTAGKIDMFMVQGDSYSWQDI